MIVNNRLIKNLPDDNVFVTANGINKTLKNAIQDGDLSGGGGSATPMEIFNATVTIGTSASTITGLLHFRAPTALTISSIVIQIFEKNGVSSGVLEVDIKKNTSPDNVGMTSIFSVKPSFDFALVANYATSSGTVLTSALSSGNYLRLDITSIPSGFRGSLQVQAYA